LTSGLIRSHPARAAAALVLLLVLATNTLRWESVPPAFDGLAVIHFRHVPLDASAPDRRRLGSLVYLGGWSLGSGNERFGGISAMHVGSDVIALTDGGLIVRFPIPNAPSGTLRGRIEKLWEKSGWPVKKEARDTEALAVAGGFAWVGYERRNIIARFRTTDWKRQGFARPAAMRHWRRNGGNEALVRLRDGRFLVFAERTPRGVATPPLLLFDGDPAVVGTHYATLAYRAPAGYLVTDAAELPDGRLLILNRRLSFATGISARLAVATLPKEGDVEGREIATFEPPVTVDNMEALSVTREGGRTIVWIASDDNYSRPLQRTLLMKFALVD